MKTNLKENRSIKCCASSPPVPGISGISDEYLLITNFTHKDGPNISARTMSAPTAKSILYLP